MFYKKRNVTSREQLCLDFGDFPPVPLHCEQSGEFSIVSLRGIAIPIWNAKFTFRLLNEYFANQGNFSNDFKKNIDSHTENLLRETGHNLKLFHPKVRSLLLTFYKWQLLIKNLWNWVLSKNNSTGPMGEFNGAFNDENSVVLYPERQDRLSSEALVSHEHIHILQHRDQNSSLKKVLSPELHLDEEYAGDTFALYLLKQNEVEARLHELVISFYRKHAKLPMTMDSFLGMLSASPSIGIIVRATLPRISYQLKTQYASFPERDSQPIEQLAMALTALNGDERIARYITEVLPVMYGNLLRYYGDRLASEQFMMSVPSQSFFSELYCDESSKHGVMAN